MEDDTLLRRIRWGNLARATGLVLLAALVIAWPRLRAPEVEVPPEAPVPVAAEPAAPPPTPARTVAAPDARPTVEPPARARTKKRPRRARKHRVRRNIVAPRAPARSVTPVPRPAPAPPPPPAPPRPAPAPAGPVARPVQRLPATTEFAPARREFGR